MDEEHDEGQVEANTTAASSFRDPLGVAPSAPNLIIHDEQRHTVADNSRTSTAVVDPDDDDDDETAENQIPPQPPPIGAPSYAAASVAAPPAEHAVVVQDLQPPQHHVPDFRQRSLRGISLPTRSAVSSGAVHHHHNHHGGGGGGGPSQRSTQQRRSLSSNHQSQLRKQARPVPMPLDVGEQRRVAAGLPGRSQSVGSSGSSSARSSAAAPSNGAGAAIIAPAAAAAAAPLLDIQRPLLDIPRAAAYSGRRSVSAPPPVESSSSSSNALEPPPSDDVHSGWTMVDVTEGEAGGVPPCERSLHASAVLNGNLLVFGGYDGSSRINDFHAFNFAERRWSPVLASANSGPPPSPRDRHVAVAHGNSFYVFGGFDGTSRVNDFFCFDFSNMTWREITATSGQPPSPRHSHAAVVHNHSLYVYGGYDGSYKSDLHEFDFNTNRWSAVNAAGRRPRARYRATCVVCRNHIVLHGGHDGTRHMADTHVFDIETRIWSALVTEGTTPTPRDSHVSVVQGSSMYVFGGSTGSAMNDLYELQLPASPTSAAKWRPIKTSGAFQPGHRFCHIGVVYQDAMYVFGGYNGVERLNDFIRFDFAVYDLSFEVPPSTIIGDLRSLVNDETLSDITFIVENQPVFAHKLMLLRSSYFRALFLGVMRESTESTIPIEQVSYPIFLNVLEYLYTDHVDIPLDSAMELFQAADLFCIPRLKTMCEKRMLQSITVENAAYIFHAADSHSATALRRKAMKFILSHFEEVSKTESFEEMGRGNMELVFEILRNR